MRGYLLLLALSCTLGVVLSQRAAAPADYDYFYDTGLDPAPPPPPPSRTSGRSRPVAQAPLTRAPAPRDDRPKGPTTTPVPILRDERRLDAKTGAFLYHYEGADGSIKHETRYPNGTVFGNFTFINDFGEPETRFYQAGALGTQIAGDSVGIIAPPTLVDETTDPNYVDLSQYDHYKHLERPYVHIAGPPGDVQFPDGSRSSASRPRAPARQPAPRPPAVAAQAPVPLDFADTGSFHAAGGFEETVAPAPPPAPVHPSRSRARRPPASVVPSPPEFPGAHIVAGQVRSPARPSSSRRAQAQTHRLASPSASTAGDQEFLDRLISQFQPAQFSGK
ncbi:uncharacterized protein LOC143025230 [Oratosquilla oratoria]|uniref:uncharacterized protein LOC143025230 n=1 Tax=Oratosquilla oratoria TaxID=337810 RepID=UPI003F76978A